MSRLDVLDPLRAYKFKVEIDGFVAAGFDEVSGLEKTTEVIEHSQGGDLGTAQKLRGRTSFSNITLRRGQTVDGDFYNWSQQVYDPITGTGATNYRRELDVVQFNEQNTEVKRWRVYNAWPNRFNAVGTLNGGTSEKVIEEMELAHEGFNLV